ncbi:MAG TPA: acyl carrier protein [Caulobacteraceae bacterium]|jgi:acyl carrier protein|nr:acyl carrier protein [Caulobacteraceae bacterium]
MKTEDGVTDSFREALDLEPWEDVATLTYRGHPKWTSLGHMTLVASLEERFDVMLESEDILDMSSFDKAVEIMGKYNDSR